MRRNDEYVKRYCAWLECLLDEAGVLSGDQNYSLAERMACGLGLEASNLFLERLGGALGKDLVRYCERLGWTEPGPLHCEVFSDGRVAFTSKKRLEDIREYLEMDPDARTRRCDEIQEQNPNRLPIALIFPGIHRDSPSRG